MSHRPINPVPAAIARRLRGAAIAAAVLTAAGMALLWPRGEPEADPAQLGLVREAYEAEVTAVRDDPCPGTDPSQQIVCPVAAVRLTSGPDEGQTVDVPLAEAFRRTGIGPGDSVVVGVQPGAPPEQRYTLLDRNRKPTLMWLAIAFTLAVVLLGGLRGIAALAGLGASLLVLLLFVLPAVLDGRDPLLVAVVGASAVAFLAIYAAHGLTTMSTVALLGTMGSLLLTALLGTLFVHLARITGLATEEAALVDFGAANIDLRGLILGGVVIGALGAIDDMTVTQASAVWELRGANPGMTNVSLFRAGMRIGRDHVASTVNTLALAYAGASMPLLVLFVLSEQSLGTVANGEVLATEIVRTLVGSIGLVAAVPLTTWLAARALPRSPEHEPPARRP